MTPNKTALITGASSGIGRQLARLFAEDGYDLVIVARSGLGLEEAATELRGIGGREIRAMRRDLSKPGSAAELHEELSALGIRPCVLVNNAGIGSCGLFHEADPAKDLEMIEVNISSLTTLTKLFARDMIEGGGGRILNVASTGAYQPGPYVAVYYATKAYVLSFSQAIRNELADYGVLVSVLCPGATMTEFSHRAGKNDAKGAMSARYVAERAYAAFMRGDEVIIPGLLNKIGVACAKLLPRSLSASFIRSSQEELTRAFRTAPKE
jgi:uncharacterized protein